MILLIPIFLFHVFITDWVLGLETVLRILVLLLLAVLVTLTTKPTEMIDVAKRLPDRFATSASILPRPA